jgi:hypothetical protein
MGINGRRLLKPTRSLPLALLLLAVCSPLFCQQQGTIIVYRPEKFVGSVLKPSVYVDGKQVGRLSNGHYFSLQLSAGKHDFESSMKASPLEVDVKAGDTVYLQMIIIPGGLRGGGRLIQASPDDAKTALATLKPMDKQAEGPDAASASEPPPAQPEQPAQPTQPADGPQAPAATSAPDQPSRVAIKSMPPGADITVDGKYMGGTPSTLQLPAGEHVILISKEGLTPWQRTITISGGGTINIDATLEKP